MFHRMNSGVANEPNIYTEPVSEYTPARRMTTPVKSTVKHVYENLGMPFQGMNLPHRVQQVDAIAHARSLMLKKGLDKITILVEWTHYEKGLLYADSSGAWAQEPTPEKKPTGTALPF